MIQLPRLIYLLRLGRPLFLAGGFVFHGLGIAIALYQGTGLTVAALIWGQVAITAIQLMTHYSNDYFDLAADRANQTPTRWSGGSRVLADGLLPPYVALWAAVLWAAIALFATMLLGLAIQPASWTVPLLLLALLLAWGYSAPPLQLHSRGLGEATVALLVPVLTVLVGYYLQTGRLDGLPLLATWPLACLQAAMILVINISDAAGDRQVMKRTLVIRWGETRAVRAYLTLLAVAYLSLPLLFAAGLPLLVVGAILIPFPMAIWQARRMGRGLWREAAAWDSLAFWSIGLLMATAVLETIAFLWLTYI